MIKKQKKKTIYEEIKTIDQEVIQKKNTLYNKLLVLTLGNWSSVSNKHKFKNRNMSKIVKDAFKIAQKN